MPTSPPVTRAEKCVYEFDGFRVDPVRRRLLRGGETVPLTPKAFSILVYLLERRGKVVEKEELLERIWPDTHVTEANLTQNVSSLRKVLGERANDHRYLVTVPGRGYSFVAEVLEIPRESTGEIALHPPAALEPPAPSTGETAETAAAALPLPPPVSAPEPTAEREALETTLVQLPAPPHGRRRFLFAGLVLGVLLALAAVGLFRAYRERPAVPAAAAAEGSAEPAAAAPARPALAVLGFRNLSKERNQAWLSTALSEMLVTELAPGSRARLVPGDEVFRLKETFSLPYTEELSAPQLAQIRDHLGADLVVVGSYLALGAGEKGGLRVDLRVVKVATGDTLASLAEVGSEDGLFDLAARLGTRLRRALGWSDPSPAEVREIQALLPGNPAAARLYAEGLARLRAFDARGARDFLEQAAGADPESAVIRSSLSLAFTALGDDARARAEAGKAVALAARLPQEQRLAIEARAGEVKKDWARAGELYRSLWTFYPDNLEYGLRLADCLSAGGHGERALAAVEEMRKLPPPAGSDPRVDLAEAWTAKRLSDAPRELRAAASAEAKGRKSGATQIVAQALALEGDGLILVGRSAEAAPRLEEARDLFAKSGNQAALAVVLTRLGMTFHERGELAEAEKLYRQALAAQERAGGVQGTALQTANLGMLDFDAGSMPQAQPLLESALASYTAAGDRVMATRMDYAIASVLLGRGELAAARERFDSVVAISRQTGNRTDEARALSGQGFVLERLGALGEARYLQDQAYEITRQLGDPIRGASALAASAGVLMRQGELAEAGKRLAQALAMKRQGGDRLGASEVLGRLAELAGRRGNLAEAERLGAEQIALARGVGSQTLIAAALRNEAGRSLDHGDLPAARQRLEEALRLRLQDGEELEAAAVRLDLADVLRLAGSPRDAARLATAAAAAYGKQGMTGYRALALARLAQALRADGRTAPAQAAAKEAQAIAEGSENLDQRLAVALAVAPVAAAAGDPAAALDLLRWATVESGRTGFLAAGLEAHLELGLLQAQTGDTAAAAATLENVRHQAELRGYRALAQRAIEGQPRGGVPRP
jgi:DNA-binding winged helix-turn-helix (wHTH) protein/tetratricopeptide (TPR) repeat protein